MVELLSAYLCTDYHVRVPEQDVVLAVGSEEPLLETHFGPLPWAVITASNPGASPLEAAENAERQRALQQRLDSFSATFTRAVNRAREGDWPDEPGFFVVGWSVTDAAQLAGSFGQNAILAGRGAGPARLALLGNSWAGLELPGHVRLLDDPPGT